ncbi:MAG TPA: 2,3-diphosphoglycerate synthetase, partial [Actinomycetota bacterium]|nr:2,3-diphosphoglycerate synthetase [Actinomycetota bacterium]
ASKDPEAALAKALDDHGATRVIDISDEPVLGYTARFRLASVALWKGAEYIGADFVFKPPALPDIVDFPSIGIIGTGKRTGKTAVAGYAAGLYRKKGLKPVIVAMGRGGPPEPEVISRPESLDAKSLLEMVDQGKHAASDYLEDALIGGVPTIGAWRAGGGLAGQTSFGNYPAAIEKLDELEPGLVILEGSGSALPEAGWDAGILIVNAAIDPSHLCSYFGYYRLLLSDLVVLTMCEESIDREQLEAVESCIRRGSLKKLEIIRTVFRPHPLADVAGKKVLYATTAPKEAGPTLKRHLEEEHDAEVVHVSHSLADRATLRQELETFDQAEVAVVELKAAGVDVVTRAAMDKDMEVVYVENRPVPVDDQDIDELLLKLAKSAAESFNK